MSLIERVHESSIYGRRIGALAQALAPLLPASGRILDVGCGDGLLDSILMQERGGDAQIEGLDVLLRPKTHIPVSLFDGKTIPFPDRSFDTVMFVDVLHHTDDPAVLLAEARRVSRNHIVIKDHLLEGFLAGSTLRFMDWVGNARHSVRLPYNYWTREQWSRAFAALNVDVRVMNDRLALYPPLLNQLFGRSLHFVAQLGVS